MRLWFFFGIFLFISPLQAKTDVLFLNPGISQESFWGDVDSLFNKAAERFRLEVETLHADRDHFRMIRQAHEVALRSELPLYVVMVNEKQSGMRMLDVFYKKPVYIQFILNDISHFERQALLKDAHWQHYLLPPIVPDNRSIGFATAEALMKGVTEQNPQVVLVSGDESTPASVERTEGALAALQSMTEVIAEQTVYGQWQETKAYQQAGVLLQRYPGLDAIWTANDHMAFGVIRAMKDIAAVPGRKIRIASINTSAEVLALRREGVINVLGGGHFLASGVALANIRRHMETGEYPRRQITLFRLLEPDTEFFTALEHRDWDSLLDIATAEHIALEH